jgi:hypothetical protein
MLHARASSSSSGFTSSNPVPISSSSLLRSTSSVAHEHRRLRMCRRGHRPLRNGRKNRYRRWPYCSSVDFSVSMSLSSLPAFFFFFFPPEAGAIPIRYHAKRSLCSARARVRMPWRADGHSEACQEQSAAVSIETVSACVQMRRLRQAAATWGQMEQRGGYRLARRHRHLPNLL